MKTLGQLLLGEEREAARKAKYEAQAAARKETRVTAKAHGEKSAWAQMNDAIVNTIDFHGIKLRPDTKTIAHKGYSGPVDATTRATVENSGQIDRRMTLTRVGAGAILFGPAGAVVGGLAKKKLDHRKVYLAIEGSGYAWVIELDAKDEKKAREFAARVSALAN